MRTRRLARRTRPPRPPLSESATFLREPWVVTSRPEDPDSLALARRLQAEEDAAAAPSAAHRPPPPPPAAYVKPGPEAPAPTPQGHVKPGPSAPPVPPTAARMASSSSSTPAPAEPTPAALANAVASSSRVVAEEGEDAPPPAYSLTDPKAPAV